MAAAAALTESAGPRPPSSLLGENPVAFVQEVGDLEVGGAISQLGGDEAVLVPFGGS